MPDLFLDSSAIFAWGDPTADEGKEIENSLLSGRFSVLTTNLVFAETISLITKRVGKSKGLAMGEKIRSSRFIRMMTVDAPILEEAWALYKKYKDKNFDLIDAASFVVCKKHGIKEILTLDRHFAQMGFRVIP